MNARVEPSLPAPRRGAMPLVLLALIIGVPFLAATVLFINPQWLPDAQTNRGTLIDPPLATADEISPLPRRGRWTLGLVAAGDCAETCTARLGELAQIRRATGVERGRVDRLLLFTMAPTTALVTKVEAQDPRLGIGRLAPGGRLARQLASGSIVMIDPRGAAMMRYAPDQPAKEILKDLQLLLKVSKEWPESKTP